MECKLNTFIGCNVGKAANGVRLGDNAVQTVVENCWFEGGVGMVAGDGANDYTARSYILDNHLDTLSLDKCGKPIVRGNTKQPTSALDLEITSNCFGAKVQIPDNSVTLNDNGVRTVMNGWGENAGDPNTTGDWNGSGYEGAAVVDTANSARYVFRNGGWV